MYEIEQHSTLLQYNLLYFRIWFNSEGNNLNSCFETRAQTAHCLSSLYRKLDIKDNYDITYFDNFNAIKLSVVCFLTNV